LEREDFRLTGRLWWRALPAATNVAVDADVTATFSEDVVGVSGTTFQLKDSSGAMVAAAVSYDSATRIATLNPTASLTNGASYTVTLTGGTSAIRDPAGNALANDTWSFTAVAPPLPDTTPPTISNRLPASGATNVAVDANVTATFSEDVQGVSGTTFQLKDASNVVVPAAVAYSSSTRTARPTNGCAARSNGTILCAESQKEDHHVRSRM